MMFVFDASTHKEVLSLSVIFGPLLCHEGEHDQCGDTGEDQREGEV